MEQSKIILTLLRLRIPSRFVWIIFDSKIYLTRVREQFLDNFELFSKDDFRASFAREMLLSLSLALHISVLYRAFEGCESTGFNNFRNFKQILPLDGRGGFGHVTGRGDNEKHFLVVSCT